ncbi:MAG: hypothetical protein ABIG30_02570, partial [Candidatus Aenigmatarchaeota archaeon]
AEDTTMIEDSAASIENMNTKAAEFAARARELVAGRDDVEKNGTEALNELNRTLEESKKLVDQLNSMKQSREHLESAATGNVILSPISAIFGVIVIVAIIIFTIQAVFFSSPKEKSPENVEEKNNGETNDQ